MVTRLSITMMTVEVKVMVVTMTKMITLMTMMQQRQYGEGSIEIDVVDIDHGIPRLDHLSTKH